MQNQGPTKADARIFLKMLQDAQRLDANRGTALVRPVILEMNIRYGVCEKRCIFLLGKWLGQEWYEYGTVIDGGWLTAKGMALEIC